MTKAEVRAFITALAQAWPDAATELQYRDAYTLLVAVVLSAQATDASVNKCTVGLFAGGAHARRHGGARGGRGRAAYPLDRAVAGQGAQCRRAVGNPAARPRRRGAARPRGAGGAARRRAQDRERRAERRVRRKHDGGRYAHFPHRQPHRPGTGQDTARSGGRAGRPHSARAAAPGTPLAHSARSLPCARHALPECFRCPAAEWCKFPDKTLAPAARK